LGFTAKKTFSKYQSTATKEKLATEAKVAAGNDNEEASSSTPVPAQEAAPVPIHNIAQKPDKVTVVEDSFTDSENSNAFLLRQRYLEEDMRQFPKEKVASLVVLWIGLFIITLMKGGKGVDSIVGITCEAPVYGVLVVVQFLWLFSFALIFGWVAHTSQAKRVAVDYPFLPGDPIWDWHALKLYGLFTFLAGIIAGLIGIGGGMVLGPMMLIMGIDPRVSTATTATMIVLTSSSVAVMFVISGLVPWSYAVFFFGVCLCGAYIGKTKIDGYVKRTGKASLLVLFLALIIAVATIGCLVVMLTRLADKGWCFDGFNEFCSVTDDDDSCVEDRMLSQHSIDGIPFA
jgi:hypothetical protein